MKEINSANEIHSILLDIAKEFHRICEKHNITYYMVGGTMLGAIRHKGFIPWDDDMDFGVPRKYIKELISALKNELPNNYSVITPLDDYGIINEIIKIYDNRTIVDEFGKEHISNRMGVFIDVFPLDRSNNNWSLLSRNKLISRMLFINNLRYYPSSGFKFKILRFAILLTSRSMYFKLLSIILPNKGNYISCYSGAYGPKDTISAKYFGNPKLYTFETIRLYGVELPKEYLRSLYGDYMQLPPEDKRHFHLKGIFWK